MAWLKEIRGMPVVSVAEGKELGKVDSLLVDVGAGTVRWLQLGKSRFFGETRVISVDEIQAIGENAITVESETAAVRIDRVTEAQELSREKRRIIGTRVLTNKGRMLGEIRDYEIDVDTFQITRYEIGKGDLLGARSRVATADYVLTIGPDAVLVDAAIESEWFPEEVDEVQAPFPEDVEEEPAEDAAPEEEHDGDWPG
ncbi:MAG: PRC-barrel domain-containing protein [Anaerolineae bacterium]